ncbi:MAG: hypothetical protein LBH59_02700 [Planctomycetaceae bacterium]|nr:hypothetical protein [Planctomycetaceae bacterium]
MFSFLILKRLQHKILNIHCWGNFRLPNYTRNILETILAYLKKVTNYQIKNKNFKIYQIFFVFFG